jgi:hypothetical protein
VLGLLGTASAAPARHGEHHAGASADGPRPVNVEVFAPEPGASVEAGGFGWVVDMELTFRYKNLHRTGFNGVQLTGPGVHNNAAPFPGSFSPGQDDRTPGLVVLASTTNATLPGFSGPGTNPGQPVQPFRHHRPHVRRDGALGHLDRRRPDRRPERRHVLTVAVIDDLDHNGIYDDAPDVVADVNHDGRIDAADVDAIGVASNVVTIPFRINGDSA